MDGFNALKARLHQVQIVHDQNNDDDQSKFVKEALLSIGGLRYLRDQTEIVRFVITSQLLSRQDFILDILEFVQGPRFDLSQDMASNLEMHIYLLLSFCHLRQFVDGHGEV